MRIQAPSSEAADRLITITSGAPAIVRSFPEFKPTRLAVMKRFWMTEHLFSSTAEYRYQVDDAPSFNWLQVVGAHTIYDPTEQLAGAWREAGPYSKAKIVTLVEEGLAHDDDIIQQWFNGDEVMQLLSATANYDELLLAVDAICGGHEVNADTAALVKRVLGRR